MKKNEATEVSQGSSEKKLSPIERLPVAIHHKFMFDCLSDQELYKLSQTSSGMLFYCREPLEKRESKKLLTHVVKGEAEQALAMIHANTKLLLHASQATDYSGRYYNNYTPFQAALLCHDVTLWKKMELYFDRLVDGQAEKAKQFKALFPAGIPQRTPYDFSGLIQTIITSSEADIQAALLKSQNETAICLAFNRFRSDFKALAMQETFFNPSHLVKAFQVYDEQFPNWSSNQRDLIWRQVIGYTQRYLPAWLAQVFVQGLCYIVVDKQPHARSLKYKYDSGAYYPLVDSTIGLGFDFAVGVIGMTRDAEVEGGGRGWVGGARRYIEQLCRSNTSELRRLECYVQQGNGESSADSDTLTSRFWCTIS